MLNIFNIHKLYIKKNTLYTENRRYMQRASSKVLEIALIRHNIAKPLLNHQAVERTMSYLYSASFSKGAKKFANDGSGKHPHVVETFCKKESCETDKCSSICNSPDKTEVKGHYTHKPPVGRHCSYVSKKDCENEENSQYFVRAIPKKEIPADALKTHIDNENIKVNKNATAFCQNNEDLIRKITK